MQCITFEMLQLETQVLSEALDQGARGIIPTTANRDGHSVAPSFQRHSHIFTAQKTLLETEVSFKTGHLEKLWKLIRERTQDYFYLAGEMSFR